ncbi:DoxX family protein, partial [Bacillus sp. ISL-39]|nr:DoxX family protein [Bacillus sp. ISL-39]
LSSINLSEKVRRTLSARCRSSTSAATCFLTKNLMKCQCTEQLPASSMDLNCYLFTLDLLNIMSGKFGIQLCPAVASLGLGLVMILAAGFHAKRKENQAIGMNIIFLALAIFVAIGRWKTCE